MDTSAMWDFRTAHPSTYALLRAYARENRSHATLAETVLWEHLRGNALGETFFRQHIIGEYIVDFVSHDSGLVIEVDGGYHAEPRQEEHDEYRTAFLESQGFHVLRFSNEEVLFNTEEVLDKIMNALER